MAPARRTPRRDPVLLYRIQSDFAAGLAPDQIAEKHTLPLYAVTQALRPGNGAQLPDPFHLARRPGVQRDATLMYWVGYVAACGSVYDGAIPTLVLDVDPQDLPHLQALVDDLCQTRPGLEYCRSSTRGLQAYVRDRDLGRLMVRWGIPGSDRGEGSVPISLIPSELLSHFVRGYLEGSQGATISSASARRIVLTGPEAFLDGLRGALRSRVRIAGTITRRKHGLATLAYSGVHAGRLLRFAYRNATRSLPRAEKLRQGLQTTAHRNGNGRVRRGTRG